MLVDSHCHLDFPDFASELDAVMTRAREAGVGICVSIGTRMDGFAGVRAIAERFADVWCSVGIHPHEAEKELLAARGLTTHHGLRLSCQIVCDHDMALKAISRLAGSGRVDAGKRPADDIQPPPVWTTKE
jgi:Tat protein secretion system quality control protein TatD with DNase activity